MMRVAEGSPKIPVPSADAWWSPYAVTAGVAVAHVDLNPDPAREAEAFEWLDEEERSSWQRYLPPPRRRFSLCRAALRAILCDRLGCRNEQLSFDVSDHGKPFAIVEGTPSSISFNVTHSGNHGLIATAAGGRLGVDIEERVPRRGLEGLIEAVMGLDERAELAALRGAERLRMFYRLWTFKEALIKALGTGFATDVSRFQVPPEMRQGGASGTFRFPHLPLVAWRMEDIGGERFAAALAYEVSCASPSPLDGSHA